MVARPFSGWAAGNHELFGLPTTLPWGLEIEASNPKFPHGLADGTLFHNPFLYEIIWNLIGVALLLLLERRFRLRWGRLFALYPIWCGLSRSGLEAIRIDPTSDGFIGIPANVWASFVIIALGVTLFLVQTRRHPGPETSIFRAGVQTPQATDDDARTPSLTRREERPALLADQSFPHRDWHGYHIYAFAAPPFGVRLGARNFVPDAATAGSEGGYR